MRFLLSLTLLASFSAMAANPVVIMETSMGAVEIEGRGRRLASAIVGVRDAPAIYRQRNHIPLRPVVVAPGELRDPRRDFTTEARSVEDTIMADLRTFEMHFSICRDAAAQILRGTALPDARDVVFLALDRQKRHALDFREIDAPAAMRHQSARHHVIDEHGVDRLQKKFRG